MNLQVTQHSVTHDYTIQNGSDFYVVQWKKLPMDDKDDIRHKVWVFEVLEPHTPDSKWQLIKDSAVFTHSILPTEKRSKKHLKNILSELQRTA